MARFVFEISENDKAELKSQLADMFKEFIEEERKTNEQFRKELLNMVKETVSVNVTGEDKPVEIPAPVPVKKEVFNKPVKNKKRKSTSLPTEVPAYKVYKSIILNKCLEIVQYSSFTNCNEVLSHAYKLLDKEYGVCLAQCEKDYRAKHGHKAQSTLAILYELEKTQSAYYQNLLLGKLGTILNEVKPETVTFPVNNIQELKNHVLHLNKVCGVNSKNAGAVYHAFFAYVHRENTGIDWEKEKEMVRKSGVYSPKRVITRMNIVDHRPELQPKVIKLYNDWAVQSKYKEHVSK